MPNDREGTPSVVFSIVSHGQLHLIRSLLTDMRRVLDVDQSIVLVLNIPEDESCLGEFSDLPMKIIRNPEPRGFGENHNLAFDNSNSRYFIIVNPDIRLNQFSMPPLFDPFEAEDVGAVAPVVMSPSGRGEDSVRKFPTLGRLLVRLMLRRRDPDYQWGTAPIDVDWSAGMFVVFRSTAFRMIGGFDVRYFMYMEDADICRRLNKAGWRIVLQPATAVFHDARRASRRNLQHLSWHIRSVFRFIFLPSK